MTTNPHADFGPLVVETDVDVAAVGCLSLWLPTYLTHFETERDLPAGLLARPHQDSYANTLDDDEFLDHRLPAVIVTTASTNAEPARDANGNYSVPWEVRVSAIVRGRTPAETRFVAAAFGGCVRRVLVQHPTLETLEQTTGPAAGVAWLSGTVAPVDDPTAAGRYLAAGINVFTVLMDSVLSDRDGPLLTDTVYPPPDPAGQPDQPYDPLATVRNITISTTSFGS